jgi:hypothetical protein
MPDDDRDTPPTVIGAIAAGVAPAPFLLTYAVLFILHGTVFPVDPPDITGSQGGEALAGLVALACLVVLVVSLAWFLSGRTRWLFLAGQLAVLGTCINFVLDSTSGQPEVPIVLIIASGLAVVLGCVPPSWAWTARGRSEADAPIPTPMVELADTGLAILPPTESVTGMIDPNATGSHPSA